MIADRAHSDKAAPLAFAFCSTEFISDLVNLTCKISVFASPFGSFGLPSFFFVVIQKSS